MGIFEVKSGCMLKSVNLIKDIIGMSINFDVKIKEAKNINSILILSRFYGLKTYSKTCVLIKDSLVLNDIRFVYYDKFRRSHIKGYSNYPIWVVLRILVDVEDVIELAPKSVQFSLFT